MTSRIASHYSRAVVLNAAKKRVARHLAQSERMLARHPGEYDDLDSVEIHDGRTEMAKLDAELTDRFRSTSAGDDGERALAAMCHKFYSAVAPLAREMADHPAFLEWIADREQLLESYPVPASGELPAPDPLKRVPVPSP